MVGIYKIENLINGKVYIGQSINISQRWTHHKHYSVSQSHLPLYRSFRKYGLDNFSFKVLEECNIEKLNERERYWIEYYDSYNNGYNLTTGGDGTTQCVVKLSKENIKEIQNLLMNTNIPQKDIAKKFNVGEDTISEINQGKTRIDKKMKYPLRERNKYIKECIKCGAPIGYNKSHMCRKCANKAQQIVKRPTKEELKQMIREESFVQIGKKFGVSDNAIRKWCGGYGLPRKKQDIKQYTDEEWEKI